jgi:predicted acetylornithine/succinylornithine family transaminase
MNLNDAYRQRFEAAIMPNYGVPPLTLARGAGCRVTDVDGKEYLDLIAGIAVSALGHAHPVLVDAVSTQVANIAHTSNLFLHEPEVRLAERLISLTHANAKVFFSNSGAEANEAAIKLVRRKHGAGKTVVVAAERSFHGRTMGSLAITGKDSIREPFGPFGLTTQFVPYGDEGALEKAVDGDTAAVFLEPGLGEGGVVPAPAGYLKAARLITARSGATLVVDEIQTGVGRTGRWFAYQAEDITPDIMTLAKGLGGGLPIGATIGFGEYADVFGRGDHGSTFGGNPVACVAAMAVLETIENDYLLDNVNKVGKQLVSGIQAIDHPLLVGVRGTGLWLAAVLSSDSAPAVEKSARDAGFLVNAVQPDAIRIAPPLILTPAEADQFITAFPQILDGATP